jgi:hypothetical protein
MDILNLTPFSTHPWHTLAQGEPEQTLSDSDEQAGSLSLFVRRMNEINLRWYVRIQLSMLVWGMVVKA